MRNLACRPYGSIKAPMLLNPLTLKSKIADGARLLNGYIVVSQPLVYSIVLKFGAMVHNNKLVGAESLNLLAGEFYVS